MYLQQQSNIPSYNAYKLWLLCSNNICSDNLKNTSFKQTKKVKDFDIKLWSNNFVFNQNDKLIFEMALYQYQQKLYPSVLNLDLEQLCSDIGYKKHIHKIRYVFDRLKAISSLRILISIKGSEFLFNFSDIECYLDNGFERVKINFIGSDNHTALAELFYTKNSPKKYVIPFKSQYELLISEFLQLKTQVKSVENDGHPYYYRYRNFAINDVLKYINLSERYNTAKEFFDDKEMKMIREIITRTLTKITKYGKINNIAIPKYRYNPKTEMYEIKDFNYPDNRTEREILLELEGSL